MQEPIWSSPCITHKLPIDQQGYTQSFNIYNFDPQAVGQFYRTFGFVIFNDVLNQQEIQASITDLWDDIIESSIGKVKRDSPQTWNFSGFLHKFGFVNDKPLSRPQLWKNRYSPTIHKAFKRLYQISTGTIVKQPLIAQFDRGSLLRPSKDHPQWKGRNLYHFDIQPWWYTKTVPVKQSQWRQHNQYHQEFQYWLGEGNYVPKIGNFTRFQGVLAFSNTGPETGGFECVGGFQNCIKEWCQAHPNHTHIQQSEQLMKNFQKVYQRAGSIIVFSRQLPHNVFPNSSDVFRYAQYLRMVPESCMCLTPEEKSCRKERVRQMLPKYIDLNDEICKEVFMLDQ